MIGKKKTTSSSPDFKSLEVPGCSYNLPHLFLIGTLSPHSLQFLQKRHKEVQLFPIPAQTPHTLHHLRFEVSSIKKSHNCIQSFKY